LRFASKRFEFTVTPDLLPLTATTILALRQSYYRDGSSVVWDVGSMLIGENAQKNEYVDVRRYVQPVSSLADNLQNNWQKLTTNALPYNGVAADDNGGMKVSTAVGEAGGAPGSGIRYALTVRNEGAPGQDAMHTQLEALQKAFKDLEH